MMEHTADGDWGMIRYRTMQTAHVIGWERKDGHVKFRDPQTANSDATLPKDAAPGSLRWANMEGYRPTPDVLKIIRGEEQ